MGEGGISGLLPVFQLPAVVLFSFHSYLAARCRFWGPYQFCLLVGSHLSLKHTNTLQHIYHILWKVPAESRVLSCPVKVSFKLLHKSEKENIQCKTISGPYDLKYGDLFRFLWIVCFFIYFLENVLTATPHLFE